MEVVFKKYRRKSVSELSEVNAEDIEYFGKNGMLIRKVNGLNVAVSISPQDVYNGSPKPGDFIARNPMDYKDMWLIAATYAAENLEELLGAEGDVVKDFSFASEELLRIVKAYIQKCRGKIFDGSRCAEFFELALLEVGAISVQCDPVETIAHIRALSCNSYKCDDRGENSGQLLKEFRKELKVLQSRIISFIKSGIDKTNVWPDYRVGDYDTYDKVLEGIKELCRVYTDRTFYGMQNYSQFVIDFIDELEDDLQENFEDDGVDLTFSILNNCMYKCSLLAEALSGEHDKKILLDLENSINEFYKVVFAENA